MLNTDIAKSILNWYDNNFIDYPWRKNKNPYSIWLSEVMLQQTQVKTAIPYFISWLNSFPNIDSVANSNIDYILKKWEGLGYYNRAHNFYLACKLSQKKYNSSVPNIFNEFITFPGVGEYIAGAVLSIAYNKQIVAIDVNIKRVFSRLEEIQIINNQDKKNIHQKILNQISKNRPGDFNQALMDIGRTICKSNKPNCKICPLQSFCKSYLNNSTASFPLKISKIKKPHYKIAVGVIKKNNQILISKRKLNGLLGGLWEFPGGKILSGETPEECIKREVKEELGISIIPKQFIKEITHQYSHFSINLVAYFCKYNSGTPQTIECQDWKWISINQFDQFAFPKANHKLFNSIKNKFN